ncbi:MAG: class II D-tagatose-bisphosphate aldolase, non-catalytic subunit [Treponema sp.]|jgi:D-tagatose-1,6-bisphosphate aldolase subunit GatZ/KbaZ|nr:class II D-tagatose-bisphosphate aldolase, non-catalytic subunit [Treponema sp.]
MDTINSLKERLLKNKAFGPENTADNYGVYSVCSAHPAVLKASMRQAAEDGSFLVIESTSNQVNQYGGYTGMIPREFMRQVLAIASGVEFPGERIIFGGDHLGPGVWRSENAAVAMEKAGALIKAYAEAGYLKLHLDASMFCADDGGERTGALPDEIAAKRAAKLCEIAEKTCCSSNGKNKPLYIIGTEVPVPGGAHAHEAVRPSSRESVLATIEITRQAFYGAGLEEAWERVIAVVAQPGVEFGNDHVFYYDHEKAKDLGCALDNGPMVFEAHSTDYQTGKGLAEMVRDHFAILKVGPWLTYAFREALFSLAHIENQLRKKNPRSNLEETLEEVMLGSIPNYWEKYYRGTEKEKAFARKYSFSDRCRYYWTDKRLSDCIGVLFRNLSEKPIPLSLLSQFMPDLFMQVCEGTVKNSPEDLVTARIQKVLALYAGACGFRS